MPDRRPGTLAFGLEVVAMMKRFGAFAAADRVVVIFNDSLIHKVPIESADLVRIGAHMAGH